MGDRMMNEEYTRPTVVWEGQYRSTPARLIHRMGEYTLEIKNQKDALGVVSWRQVEIPKLDGSWVNLQELIGALLRGKVTKEGETIL